MDIVRGFEPRVPGSNPGEGTLKMILFNNMKKLLSLLILLTLTVSLLLPLAISAADNGPIVQCKHDPCDFQDLLDLVPRVINFILLDILTPTAILFLTIGGLVLLSSGGNPERRSLGMNILKATIIGIFLALGAWVIVNFVLTVLGAKGLG